MVIKQIQKIKSVLNAMIIYPIACFAKIQHFAHNAEIEHI